jgi:hypothetical protein
MKIKITRSHITENGAIAPGAILDVPDTVAVDYLNAKLAEPVKTDATERATVKKTKETATAK